MNFGAKLIMYLTFVLQNNKVSLQLIFFDGEESFENWSGKRGNYLPINLHIVDIKETLGKDHTYGSRNLAERWKIKPFEMNHVSGNTLQRIDLFILLDLIGTPDTSFKCQKVKTQVKKLLNQFNFESLVVIDFE